jgi:PHD/YefM family antitoxin component YafN of YafNO toxin-antitoxin module
MPIFNPISELRNNLNEISELAHGSGEPIFITTNGKEDLDVMSLALHGRLPLKRELLGKLDDARATGGRRQRPQPFTGDDEAAEAHE